MLLIHLALGAATAQPAPSPPQSTPSDRTTKLDAAWKRSTIGSSLKGSAGPYYARLFDIATYGAEASLAIGPFWDQHFSYFAFDLQRGRTEHGRSIWSWHVGASTEWAFGRLRLGGSARFGELRISRVTDQGTDSSVSLGVAVHASIDALRFSDDAVFVVATFRADSYSNPLVWGPSIAIGYRWDFVARE